MFNSEACSTGVSWSAVIGGAFVTASLSVILLALGAGLGLSAISPWTNVGISASSAGAAAIIWLIAMQIISSSMGGFLAGRLRIKWPTIDPHEVYFRDTVHGFLVWAVALVITALFLVPTAAFMVGGTMQHDSLQINSHSFDSSTYFVDTLLRSNQADEERNDGAIRAEVGLILANALMLKEIPAADRSYLRQLIMAKAAIGHDDADDRLSAVFTEAQKFAETTRKAAMQSLLWLFIALLTGAFFASYSATIGGRQRDTVEVVAHSFDN